ncbi:MAG: Ser-Thr-rich GPI-anchored membrane family protein [bacterium]|nr:Ser-Thr-rich GPI-anchored membrane family protein [bacterium]
MYKKLYIAASILALFFGVFVSVAMASSGFVMKEFTLPSGLKVIAVQSIESAAFRPPEPKLIGSKVSTVVVNVSLPYAGFGGGGGGGGKSDDVPRPKAFIKILTPNGGEVLEPGKTYTIKWESEQVPQIYIKLRKGDDTYPGPEGVISNFIKNEGFFMWEVPKSLPLAKDYSIRILDKDAPKNDVYDDSDAQFTILSAPLFIETISPSSGPVKTKVMLTGFNFTNDADANDITFWPAEGDGTVFQHIWDVISPDGKTLEFIIPATLLKFSKDYSEGSIEIPVSPGVYNFSLSNTNGKSNIVQFTVINTSAPSITVLSPNGGEILEIGKTYEIQWSSVNISYPYLTIELRRGKSASGEALFTHLANDGSEQWTISSTLTPADDYVIYIYCTPISGVAGCEAIDSSDAPFSIVAATGSINVSVSDTVGNQNIAQNVLNQPLGALSVDVQGESISVGRIGFNVTLGSEGANADIDDITNIVLVDESGTVVAGPVDGMSIDSAYTVGSADGSVVFTDTFTIPIGVHTYTLKGKIGTDIDNNVTIQFSTTPNSDFAMVKGLNTGNDITPSPSSVLSLATMTVKTGALAISTQSVPISQNVVAGTSQFEFARYSFNATASSEDVRVNSIPLAYGVVAGNANDLTNCKLYDGVAVVNSSNIVNPASASSFTNFTFDGFGLTVAKGTSKIINLKCDVRSGSSGQYQWGLDSGQQTSYTGATGLTSGQTIAETLNDSAGQIMTAVSGGEGVDGSGDGEPLLTEPTVVPVESSQTLLE